MRTLISIIIAASLASCSTTAFKEYVVDPVVYTTAKATAPAAK
jgi:hypothetical protein